MKLTVATPERVALKLPLAGLGPRSIAQAIDLSILLLLLALTYFGFTLLQSDVYWWLSSLSSLWRIALLVAVFGAVWIYWTAFEVLWNGQTPGKRWAKIRVVRQDGSPVGLVESSVRNLLRVLDFAPLCYPVGVITMLIDPLQRRLGDLAAGTVLVREQAVDLAAYATEAAGTLGPGELEALQDFLRRLDTLSPDVRRALAQQLAKRLGADEATQAQELDGLIAYLRGKVSG